VYSFKVETTGVVYGFATRTERSDAMRWLRNRARLHGATLAEVRAAIHPIH
jgi:hypothetical protein